MVPASLLLLALACQDGDSAFSNLDSSAIDSADTAAGDTAAGDTAADDTGIEEDTAPLFADRGCHDDGEGSGLGPEGEIGDLRWRTVTIPGGLFDELRAVVIYPADTSVTAWTDGAPVVVVAPPNFTVDPSLESAPKPIFDARYGVIEVQPVYPGWTVGGVTTSGALDDGGLSSGSALSETIRFAAGLVSLDRGTTLSHVVERPICNARVGLLGVGTGGVTIMEALAPMAAVGVSTVGFALFEVPTLPQLITGDVGTVWMDPDANVDGDGNGIAWDDGRNVDWYEGDCDTINCALDYEDLAWDPITVPSEVFPGRFADAPPGVLYLDRGGSGSLEIAEGGGLDIGGDGVVDEGDDFVFLPHYGSDGGVYYNSHLTRYAETELSSWPAGVATLAQSEAFWGTRTVMEEARVVVDQYEPNLGVVVAFTEADSLLALADRPQAVMAHDLFAEAGWSARYNLRGAALDCLVDPTTSGGWAGGPARGTALEEADTQSWAIPEALDDDAAALAGLSLLWDAFGAFDRCPGAASAAP